MKRRRISDREIRDEMRRWDRHGDTYALSAEILRCRRALRRILSISKLRCSNEGLVYTVNAIREVSAKALGKWEKA